MPETLQSAAAKAPAPNRDARLDVLRGLGIVAILIAHTGAPPLLFQIRNFDVPLMAMLVGASFALSRSAKGSYWDYLFTRTFRLVAPVWIFLTVVFLAVFAASQIFELKFPYFRNQIISSYLLLQGIGAVWIIRVFVLVGALLPLVRPRLLKLPSAAAVAVCVAAFGLYELARHLDVKAWPKPLSLFYSEVFLFAIPYTLLALLGGILARPAARLHAMLGLGFLAIFVGQAFYYGAGPGRFIQTQGFKYPPQLYYLAYAIGASFLISACVQWSKLSDRTPGQVLAKLGQQTMWIYLWHILFIELFELFGWNKLFQSISLNGLSMGFPLYFVSIAGLSIGFAKFQHFALERWIAPRLSEPRAAGVRRIFTG